MLHMRPRYFAALLLSAALHGVLSLAMQASGSIAGMPSLPATPAAVVGARLVPAIPLPDADAEPAHAVAQPAATPVAFSHKEHAPPLPVLTMPDPYYFSARELSERPQVLHSTNPDPADMLDVPPQAAVFRLLINEKGTVDRVVPENSSLPERAEQAMIAAFLVSTFVPGKIDAVSVKSQLRIEIQVERDTVSF